MATRRGMNMRDMKAEQMGKRPRGRPPKVRTGGESPPAEDGDERVLEDSMENAVHTAGADGQFVATKRFTRDDEDDKDCPDEAPPGWCGDD